MFIHAKGKSTQNQEPLRNSAPSVVGHQRQSYADDFVKHHQRFGGKVDAWKAALTQAAGLSGWDSQVTRPESTLVTEIVKDIVKN
ncbi:hypothetical protein QL285_023353 [Trifolium repens]|nr:hypothetical protein QL285_023353 [Trifolium repens]